MHFLRVYGTRVGGLESQCPRDEDEQEESWGACQTDKLIINRAD